MTRRLLFLPAVILWLCALAYRAARALEADRGEEDSWTVLALCWIALAWYVVFVVYIHAVDHQWLYGWRK